MLRKNKGFMFIRCNQYQYLVKKGSMSNHSYNILDENKIGILSYLFEVTEFPLKKTDLLANIQTKLLLPYEEASEYIENLINHEILLDEDVSVGVKKACLFTNGEISGNIDDFICTKNLGLDIEKFVLTHQDIYSEYDADTIETALSNADVVIAMYSHFAPALFYELNSKCVELNKMLVIAYLDGNEGVIIPLSSPTKSGCYNDFEILRESSFHNLIDYQVMKESLINEDVPSPDYDSLYLELLLLNSALIIRSSLISTYINQFAYSYDFERMINAKTKLMRFPNCPSCQGDSNISHPFI